VSTTLANNGLRTTTTSWAAVAHLGAEAFINDARTKERAFAPVGLYEQL